MGKILLSVCFLGTLMAQTPVPQYTKDGQLMMPADYREWVYLSSGLGMSYNPTPAESASPRFTNVFVNPAAYKSFLQTGTWPDKTVFILEIRRSESKLSINTGGRVQSDLLGIEAEVKDAEHGGWVFYDIGTAKQGKAFSSSAPCYSCHRDKGAVDNTFVQFYPTLLEVARQKKTLKAIKE